MLDPTLLALADFKTVIVSASDGPGTLTWVGVGLMLALWVGLMLRLPGRVRRGDSRESRQGPRPKSKRRSGPRPRADRSSGASRPKGPRILIDGSNVMHWQDNTPKLAPLLAVVAQVQAQGYVPGVVFDATAGWKLFGRYLHDKELARLLGLTEAQVMVVPKGQQADPYLLDVARQEAACIITNDRFRDWEDRFPEVRKRGHLVRGGWQEGQVHLRDLQKAKAGPVV